MALISRTEWSLIPVVFQAVESISVLIASWSKVFDSLFIVSISVGFISSLIGELGRRQSHSNLLRLYIFLSSTATAFLVANVVWSNLIKQDALDQNFSPNTSKQLYEAACVIVDLLLQIFIVITTIRLLQNMSPKRV
ncbi:hypothetical protein HPP92_020994 [Vanilla planifolia]|uniref:Uncharacterized protein n=1 Tax=Vanilla planifolia TaxID=51239 RepID=A0A835Q070_VANPL|nr:hypothetical protein HPP92_020994 [Vanilla planifolia]